MPTRSLAVAFDVLETLLDLAPLHDRFAEIGQPTHLVQPWFLRVQRDCMALTLSGDFAEFYPAARQALRTESGQSVTEEQIDHVLEAFGTLPAHPDADPAMRRLAAAGLRVVASRSAARIPLPSSCSRPASPSTSSSGDRPAGRDVEARARPGRAAPPATRSHPPAGHASRSRRIRARPVRSATKWSVHRRGRLERSPCRVARSRVWTR